MWLMFQNPITEINVEVCQTNTIFKAVKMKVQKTIAKIQKKTC